MSGELLRLITPNDLVADFDCGVHALNDFLKRHALRNSQSADSVGKTWLLHRAPEDPVALPTVLGFVTLSMSHVSSEQVGQILGKRLPLYPSPVALIGRLAVDRRARGLKLGRILLREAFSHVLAASRHLGCVGVLVEAKDEKALGFFEHAGFTCLDQTEWPRPLYLPLSTIRELLRGSPGRT